MHVWCRMLFLTCSSKLATLRKALTHSFPESLKACGALHHVINKNSFNLQVLVDQWPDFTSVICRPPLEEMTDPSDRYTNTYFLFSKDQQRLSEMLQNPHVINWTQELQIQGCQTELGEVLRDVSAKHRSGIRFTSNILYMRDSIQSSEVPEQPDSNTDLQFSSLSPDESSLVNAKWAFGVLRWLLNCILRVLRWLLSCILGVLRWLLNCFLRVLRWLLNCFLRVLRWLLSCILGVLRWLLNHIRELPDDIHIRDQIRI
ncbi:glycine N-acyltransferase-like protein 2 isoform 6-T8 [Discoglossus pictus]